MSSATPTVHTTGLNTIAGHSSRTAPNPPHVEAHNLSKRFGPLQALTDVSVKLPPGKFRALLGENGAGKSTLVKCIMGTYRADTGRVIVGAGAVELRSPRHAHALGIGMVYQHFTLVENMTVVENMVIARERLPAIIHWKEEAAKLAAFMDKMPFRVEPTKLVRHLSAGEKQKVELLKQLYLQRKVLILDEPTSVLTPNEADELLGMVRTMCTDGHVSVMMITHKFREVMSFCDEVSVLRRGKLTGEGSVRDLTPEDMAKMMMGTATAPKQAERASITEKTASKAPLVIDSLNADDETGVAALSDLSLEVNAHEIVGIAGVSGNGQRELVQVLAGQRDRSSGSIRVHGEEFGATRPKTPAASRWYSPKALFTRWFVDAGFMVWDSLTRPSLREQINEHKVRLLPEMPLQNACVPTMTVAENMAFRLFDKPPFTWGRWFLKRSAMKTHAEKLIERYNVRPPWPWATIGHLSGGNVQRAVLAREMGEADVKVLIVANPCFGLDFKSAAEIRSQIMEARNRGAAVLLVSEDLDEILELADRVLVISDGHIVHDTPIAHADRQAIGHHMAGHGENGH